MPHTSNVTHIDITHFRTNLKMLPILFGSGGNAARIDTTPTKAVNGRHFFFALRSINVFESAPDIIKF